MGEAPPRDRGKQGPSTQTRCQLLRVSLPSKFWSKSGPKLPTVRAKVRIRELSGGEVLPKDKRELEAASSGQSTESDEGGAVLASSSATPWQRRVRLRTALEAKDKTRNLVLQIHATVNEGEQVAINVCWGRRAPRYTSASCNSQEVNVVTCRQLQEEAFHSSLVVPRENHTIGLSLPFQAAVGQAGGETHP